MEKSISPCSGKIHLNNSHLELEPILSWSRHPPTHITNTHTFSPTQMSATRIHRQTGMCVCVLHTHTLSISLSLSLSLTHTQSLSHTFSGKRQSGSKNCM
jgi:hypothetical protein